MYYGERQNMSSRANGVTVQEAVHQVLTRNYPIYQTLKMKIVNFHSLAELVQPQIEQLVMRKTTINALVVAIKRYSDKLDETKAPEPSRVLKDARIALSSNMVDLTINVPRTQFSTTVKDLSDVGGGLSEFPNIFPLTNSIKMILPGDDYDAVKTKLERFKVTRTQANAAKLTLNMSTNAEMTPGIASYITELLYRNGVNILDAFLGYGDILMVVDERDGPLAYEVLQKEIHASSK